MERLGVGYDDLKKINNKLIYCSLTGYGSTGPYNLKAGHDINYMAISGLLNVTGNENELPPTLGFQAADTAGAMQAVIGILSAIIERNNTNIGQFIDISLTESVMTLGLTSLVSGLFGEQLQRGKSTLNGGLPNYRNYKTKDNLYLSVGALEGHFWSKLCKVINRPDLDKIPDIIEIEKLFESKTLNEWNEIFKNEDVCVEPILKPEEIINHPQHISRNIILEDPELNDKNNKIIKRKQLVLGPKFSTHTSELLPPAPKIGEHTDIILKNVGYSNEQIKELHDSGVIYCLNLDPLLQPLLPPDSFTQAKPYRVNLEANKEYWWCKCGKSKNQPFCDGTHKELKSNIKPEKVIVQENTTFPFCGCRLSKLGARCDGTHKRVINNSK